MEDIELTTGSKKVSLEDSPTKQKAKKLKPYIGNIDDPNLEEYIKDNKHLTTGWRICYHTYWECARSLFQIHNETMNVWSHLIGALFFMFMALYVLIYLAPATLQADKVGLS